MSQIAIKIQFIRTQAAINATRKLIEEELGGRDEIAVKAVVTEVLKWLDELERALHGQDDDTFTPAVKQPHKQSNGNFT